MSKDFINSSMNHSLKFLDIIQSELIIKKMVERNKKKKGNIADAHSFNLCIRAVSQEIQR